MFNKMKLPAKLIGAIVLVLAVTSGISLWIMQSRINRQADEAFRDKLRQITGMASATRNWFAANVDVMVPNRDFKHLEQVPVVVAMRTAEQYASKEGMKLEHRPCTRAIRQIRPRSLKDGHWKHLKKIRPCRNFPSVKRGRAMRSCITRSRSELSRTACSATANRQERKIRSAIPRKE